MSYVRTWWLMTLCLLLAGKEPGFAHWGDASYKHDHLGWCVKKMGKTWTGSGYGNPVTTRYLYDGWRLVAELSGSSGSTVLRSYAWGLDLSHTLDEAGGVGG